jgi:hypothetical protein
MPILKEAAMSQAPAIKWNYNPDYGVDHHDTRVLYPFTDEKGRPVGHRFEVRAVDDYLLQSYKIWPPETKYVYKSHITRSGMTYGAVQPWRPLKSQTITEAFEEVEVLAMPAARKRAEKAMARRRADSVRDWRAR